MMNGMKLGIIITATAGLFAFTAVGAAEIKVLAAGATKEVCLDVIPAFEKKFGHKLVATWSGTVDIKKRMAAGEVYDLVIVAAPEIDAFIKQGKMLPGSRVDLMKSAVGVAVRAGAPKADIGTSEALRRTLLAVPSIGYSTGPSGEHVVSMFERMGIADQIRPKLKQAPPGVRISTLIASGEVAIGFQQVSELIHEAGIDYLGPLPADVQKITLFSAGIPTQAREPEGAKALVKELTSPAAASAIKNHGMEPG